MRVKKEVAYCSFILSIFLLLCQIANAQQWMPDFKHFTTRDGLPSSEVYQITSDAQNNLWFSTDRGAVKYDGYTFRTYDIRDSIPDNSIIKLYKDEKGRIWFITYTGLLSYYENGKITPYKFNDIIYSHIRGLVLVSLYVDEMDNVLLNTVEGKIFMITSNGQFRKVKKNLPPGSFILNTTRKSSVSVNYVSGLYNSTTSIFVETIRDTFSITLDGRIVDEHFAATRLRNDDILFYCKQYVIRIRPDRTYDIKKVHAPILNIFEDASNDIWIGTKQGGMLFCDSRLNVISRYFNEISVSHIFSDFEGGIWMNTLENGIYYLSSKGNLTFAIGDNQYHDKLTSLINLSDSVLIFSSSKGILFKYNQGNNEFRQIDFKKTKPRAFAYINSLSYDKADNRIILSVSPGFTDSIEIGSTLKWHDLNLILLSSLINLGSKPNGNILAANYSFVFNFNLKTKIATNLHKELLRFTTIYEDSRGRIYAGTLRGLYSIKDGKLFLVDSTASLSKLRISDIKELKEEYMVFGTRSNGIIIYRDSIVKQLSVADGLSSDDINNIEIEDNIIWAGTSKGINRITVNSLTPFSISVDHINRDNGLISDEVYKLSVGKNVIYVATSDGLYAIAKDQFSAKINHFPVYITSFKVNERDTVVTSGYNLDHRQNNIGISFTGLSFRNSKNIIYRYRLIGLDSTWRTTSTRDVQFTGLGSGNYTFELVATREGGVFQKQPIAFKFTISQSIYEKTWFRLSGTVVLALMLFASIQYRIKRIKKKADEKIALDKKFSELNLNALRSQMNPHFTFNVLNSIKYYIAKNEPEAAQFYISKFAKLIRMILEQSRTDYISLREEIEMLKLYMELEELRFENKFSYTINTDKALKLGEIFIPGMLIQPFVENSIKHGMRFKKGDARVQLHFASSDSVLICSVTDNGIGREEASKLKSPEEDYKSMGTAIVNERIEALSLLYNGKLRNYTSDLKDEEGNPTGTCVTIEIPFKRNLV